jgi:hypothetical protein
LGTSVASGDRSHLGSAADVDASTSRIMLGSIGWGGLRRCVIPHGVWLLAPRARG